MSLSQKERARLRHRSSVVFTFITLPLDNSHIVPFGKDLLFAFTPFCRQRVLVRVGDHLCLEGFSGELASSFPEGAPRDSRTDTSPLILATEPISSAFDFPCQTVAMATEGNEVKDERPEMHEEGGDDEVRFSSFLGAPTSHLARSSATMP